MDVQEICVGIREPGKACVCVCVCAEANAKECLSGTGARRKYTKLLIKLRVRNVLLIFSRFLYFLFLYMLDKYYSYDVTKRE